MLDSSLPQAQVEAIIDRTLAEDLPWGDVTTQALVPPDLIGRGQFLAKAQGVLAGIGVACLAFRRMDPRLQFRDLAVDGSRVLPGQGLGWVEGSLAGILQAERTALNLLQRMSGIATATAYLVEAVKGLPVTIIDTRKTAPGLRIVDKYAVRVGGGQNHRFNLCDGVLIKDNHLAALHARGLGLREAIAQVRRKVPFTLKVEVEVTDLDQAREAAEAGADIIMLDNMTPDQMREAVALLKGRALIEASGGITLATVRAVAEAGVDFISSGSLTHSVKGLDISLEVEAGSSP